MTSVLSISGVLLVMLLLFYCSYSIKAGVYIKSLCRKETGEKVVALTFDDGPHQEQTPKILEILATYGMEAAFFCIGANIEGNIALTKKIDDGGHIIGNHSYCHSNGFPCFGLKRLEQDIRECDNLIESVTGRKTNFFRPPFGVTNPIVAKAINNAGHISVGWSIRSLDTTCKGDIGRVLKRIKRQLKPGSVILLHDRLPFSDKLLTGVIELLLKNGYRVERIDKMFGKQRDRLCNI